MMTNVLTTQLGVTVNFALFTLFAFILGFGSIFIWLALCKYVYKPDVSKIKNSTFVYENTEKLNAYQKQVLLLLAALVFFMFLPGFLPECGLKTFLNTLGNTGMVVVALMICSLIVKKDGKSFAEVADLIKSGVP